MSSPGSLLLFCAAWQQDTFGAYDQSYTFAQPFVRQPDGVNCVVRGSSVASPKILGDQNVWF